MLLTPVPLVLDLDGTLIRTDTFHEMIVHLVFRKPLLLFLLPFWFLKGRAYAKARLRCYVDLCPSSLPYNSHLLTFATSEAQKGRSLILATGTDQKVAEKIAQHLGIFQDVIGSYDTINMTGPNKQKALIERFGHEGFDYAGDSIIDLHVWSSSRKALVVHPKKNVLRKVQRLKEKTHIIYFPREKPRILALVLALRPLMWAWNIFSFSWGLFLSLSFLSSALFIGVDLLMLSKERTSQPQTLLKPSIFAEGHLHLTTALLISSGFLAFFLILSSYLLSFGVLLSLAYAVVFITLDRTTRPLTFSVRWTLLSICQIMFAFLMGRLLL